MTANERYEKTWNQFLVQLDKDTSLRLTPFLREQSISIRGMQQWMQNKGLAVKEAKTRLRMCHAGSRKEPHAACPASPSSSDPLFLPVETPVQSAASKPADMLSGISFTFPDGTQVSIKSGTARAVMSFMKLYQREDALCLD